MIRPKKIFPPYKFILILSQIYFGTVTNGSRNRTKINPQPYVKKFITVCNWSLKQPK